MKTVNTKFTKLLFLALLVLASCDVDNLEPINELTEDNVIRDGASANAVLNRVYTLHRNSATRSTNAVDMSIALNLSGIDQEIGRLISPNQMPDFSTNNTQDDSEIIQEYYEELYLIINTANFLIEKLEEGPLSGLSEERSLEIQAEARTMRAMAHFHALRVWGQYYDMGSDLGVVLGLKPIRGNEATPRSSVQEVYDAILTDLQFGIANGPSNRERFYMSATLAQALLAKVHLYMGDFTNAAANARAVIENTEDNFELYTGSYLNIWQERWENPEVLFAPFANGRLNNEDNGEGSKIPVAVFPSSILLEIADKSTGAMDGNLDPRYPVPDEPFFPVFLAPQNKYPRQFNQEIGNTYYYMRMAEVYLIHAEAETRRAGGNTANALVSLNAVRQRQGVPDKTFVDSATLLSDIMDEKSIELFWEVGESWFDLVRYHINGDLDAFALKESLNNVNQFIFPIPNAAIVGNPALTPNP